MKRMYWRPRRVSRTALVLISVWSIVGFATVERFPTQSREPYYKEKYAAAKIAREAFQTIRKERVKRRIRIDPETDIAQSGLIGLLVSPISTNAGSLVSKQTAINPNFAAMIVHDLRRGGVTNGDVVAIGYSGSFPAMNIAVLAAVEAMQLKPVIISSASSSQWGANDPRFTWLEMEKILFDAKIISTRSVAASLGGIEDRALGMRKRGQAMLQREIEAHGITFLEPENFLDSVQKRMKIYEEQAAGAPIRAYINVGGGTTSVGRKAGKLSFKPGLNRKAPSKRMPPDSIMGRFVTQGIPVIHVIKIKDLAAKYGFPLSPVATPAIGEGRVFKRLRPNPWYAGALLTTILVALYLFVRSDLGLRMTRTVRPRGGGGGSSEPMV